MQLFRNDPDSVVAHSPIFTCSFFLVWLLRKLKMRIGMVQFLIAFMCVFDSMSNFLCFPEFQFSALSDQLYHSPDHHNDVRRKVVNQVIQVRNMILFCSIEL